MIKRITEKKKQREEIEKQQHFIVIKNNFLKVLLQKVFKVMTRCSRANFTKTVDGAADLPARNLLQHKKFHVTSLSSLLDCFWS